jgi:hypothetical protein
MEIKAEKCATTSYVMDGRRRTYLSDNFTFQEREIPNLTAAESLRYLGAPIVTRKTVRFKSAKFKLKEMESLLEKIMSSPLRIVQKIDAMKTFLLPSIDFLLLNEEVGINQLKNMDKKIRGRVDRELKIKGLPIECHHASWRDGELSYPSLQDRGYVLTIRSFAQMMPSRDDMVRSAMRQFIDDERRYRRIVQCPNAQFLDWGEEEQSGPGTSTIIVKTRRACEKLDVTLKLEERRMMIKAKESEFKTVTATIIGRFLIQKIIRPQKITSLLRKEKHGATFEMLKDNKILNKMLTDVKTTKSDAFFRFTVAARADLLPTPANIQ